MRFPFAFLCVVAASCAAPPESSAPMPSEVGEAQEDSTPAERTGEAQDPWTRAQCQDAFVENLRKCDSWTNNKEVCQGMCAALLVACIALTKE
jgi:hypothetical protein